MLFLDSIFSIDSLLGGGVFTGELTEISGQSSVGKTQVQAVEVIYLLFYCYCSFALMFLHRLLYIQNLL